MSHFKNRKVVNLVSCLRFTYFTHKSVSRTGSFLSLVRRRRQRHQSPNPPHPPRAPRSNPPRPMRPISVYTPFPDFGSIPSAFVPQFHPPVLGDGSTAHAVPQLQPIRFHPGTSVSLKENHYNLALQTNAGAANSLFPSGLFHVNTSLRRRFAIKCKSASRRLDIFRENTLF